MASLEMQIFSSAFFSVGLRLYMKRKKNCVDSEWAQFEFEYFLKIQFVRLIIAMIVQADYYCEYGAFYWYIPCWKSPTKFTIKCYSECVLEVEWHSASQRDRSTEKGSLALIKSYNFVRQIYDSSLGFVIAHWACMWMYGGLSIRSNNNTEGSTRSYMCVCVYVRVGMCLILCAYYFLFTILWMMWAIKLCLPSIMELDSSEVRWIRSTDNKILWQHCIWIQVSPSCF